MNWSPGTLLVAALAVLASSCGTVCNLASEKPEIYGGVAKDLEFAQTPNPGAPIRGKRGRFSSASTWQTSP